MATAHPGYTTEEICRRGEALYKGAIRGQVECPQNRGKMVIIDIETGAWEMGDDDLDICHRFHARRPGAALYGARVGYPAAAKLGGSWEGALRRQGPDGYTSR